MQMKCAGVPLEIEFRDVHGLVSERNVAQRDVIGIRVRPRLRGGKGHRAADQCCRNKQRCDATKRGRE